MCSFKTPKVPKVETPATAILPSTITATPEAPAYGDTKVTRKKKGKNALKINLGNTGSSSSTGLSI